MFQPQVINSPQIDDEAVLYKLNAEVRLESRKGSNSINVKEIIRKFKQDHPQLMDRLRQSDRSNTRTDISANYSDNSKRQNSSTELNKIQHSNTMTGNVPFLEKRLTGNTFKTQHLKAPVIICEASDFDSDPRNSNERNTYSAQSPIHGRSNTNNKNLGPTVIFSTSDDAENEHLNKGNYTSVKSSNELLTSVMNIDDDDCTSETENEKEKPPSFSGNAAVDAETRDTEARTYTNDYKNNIPDVRKDVNKENDIINLVDASSESDIDEALTQIIESIDESNHKSSDETSIDEELMQETVDEINEDLAKEISIENIILTPPMGFRD